MASFLSRRRAGLFAALVALFVLQPADGLGGNSPQDVLEKFIRYSSQPGRSLTLILHEDIILTRPLPAMPNGGKLSIRGACAGRQCVISGNGQFPIFTTGDSFDTTGRACYLTLSNVELTGAVGGAVSGACSLTADTVSFRDNVDAELGGAVHLTAAAKRLVLVGCHFHNNRAAASGGAIYSETRAEVTGCTFAANTAPQGGAFFLKAAWAQQAFLRNNTFANNAATVSGGALTIASPAFVITSNFLGNQAPIAPAVAIDTDRFTIGFCANFWTYNVAQSESALNSVTALQASPKVFFCPSVPEDTISLPEAPFEELCGICPTHYQRQQRR